MGDGEAQGAPPVTAIGYRPPRLAPPAPEDWGEDVLTALETGRSALLSDELQAALDSRSTERLSAVLPAAITTLFHNPALAGGWLAFNGALLSRSSLSGRQRELIVLRVAWLTRSQYEWSQHVRMAPRFGISREEVLALAKETAPDEADGWEELEADLISATDQLLRRFTIDDRTWAALGRHLDDAQMLEIPFVVGAYALLAAAFNSFAIPIDPHYAAPDTPPLPEEDR